jgi:hypothetical protein
MERSALRRKIPLESEIQSAICDYLALRKHFFWRQNTSPTVQKGAEGWSFRRMPKYAMRGVADIIVVHVGRPYFLEVKRPGSYQTPEQREFQVSAEKAGALYAVVRSIEDVQLLGL